MNAAIEPMRYKDHVIHPASVKLLPQVFCFSSSAVILGEVDLAGSDPIEVGMAEPHNLNTLDTITRRFSPRRIIPVQMTVDDVTRALNMAYGISTPALETDANLLGAVVPQGEVEFARMDDRVQVAQEPIDYADQEYERIDTLDVDMGRRGRSKRTDDGQPSVVHVVNDMLMDALRRGATDIHLENERKAVKL
ncbi:hypothetical protein KDL45_12595, partial [bacterium]|nr:hypothetical protein [bacterium]